MKRWWILAAMMVLMMAIPVAGMAEEPCEHAWGAWAAFENEVHFRRCTKCYEEDFQSHTSADATCSTQGQCTVCYSWYTDESNHEGTPTYTYEKTSDTQHKVIGEYSCCNSKVFAYADHTGGGATCITQGMCKDCNELYYDSDTHKGMPTTTYEKTSDTQHKVIVTYDGCKHIVESTQSHDWVDATCTEAKHC